MLFMDHELMTDGITQATPPPPMVLANLFILVLLGLPILLFLTCNM